MSSSNNPDHAKRYFTPYDGAPGRPYDDFVMNLKNVAAGKTDDRGFSLADHIDNCDEGGANPPPGEDEPISMPNSNTAAHAKAVAARRRRTREAYSLIVGHISNEDIKRELSINYMQDGIGAWEYVRRAARLQRVHLAAGGLEHLERLVGGRRERAARQPEQVAHHEARALQVRLAHEVALKHPRRAAADEPEALSARGVAVVGPEAAEAEHDPLQRRRPRLARQQEVEQVRHL